MQDTLIAGGMAYLPGCDPHAPPVRDILVRGGQIGNVKDWVADMPGVFVASAVADSGLAVLAAVEDFMGQRLGAGRVRSIGLERPEAVRLAVGAAVSSGVQQAVTRLAADVVAGRITPRTEWSGEEFPTPT